MSWQSIVGLILLVCALLVGAYYLGGEIKERDIALLPRDTTTTIVVAPHVLPPATVTPNPAPAKPIKPTVKERLIVDSLISRIANRDSLIRSLMSNVGTEQSFMSKDPTGLDVSGDLTILYSPMESHFLTQVTLDTIKVPVKVVTVTQTLVEDRLAWEWIVSAAAVGAVVGALVKQ